MSRLVIVLLLTLTLCATAADKEVSTIKTYVDTNVCAHLMLGPITTARMDCSKKAIKEGDSPILVELKSNTLFEVNKAKMLKDLVGQFAEATGELKVKDGQMKLQEIKAIEAASIPAGDPARKLLDVRTYKTVSGPELHEKVRHELAMMPYITEYDFISFSLNGPDVILTGWTVRQTNRSEAENRVKTVAGVESVVNNIEILPLGRFDMSIRAGVRANLQRFLARYFWGSGSDIKIIVKNGVVILLGSVASKADSDIATIQTNSVASVFKVVNLLRVATPEPKEKKG